MLLSKLQNIFQLLTVQNATCSWHATLVAFQLMMFYNFDISPSSCRTWALQRRGHCWEHQWARRSFQSPFQPLSWIGVEVDIIVAIIKIAIINVAIILITLITVLNHHHHSGVIHLQQSMSLPDPFLRIGEWVMSWSTNYQHQNYHHQYRHHSHFSHFHPHGHYFWVNNHLQQSMSLPAPFLRMGEWVMSWSSLSSSKLP